ncbi:MAG TPA: hypothetical protein DIW47_13415 [Bacteroidetes bacterium]|nr:hypothetical protein [Bacteroidota bacterium]
MTATQKFLVILYTLSGAVLAFLFNYLILDSILIPDPCYYHSHEPGLLFHLFYDLPSSEGYHPFPSVFNFIFTLTIGALSGLAFSKYLIRKHNEK